MTRADAYARLVSPCCAAPVRVQNSGPCPMEEQISYWYVCSKCGQPCDPVKGEE